ncbi:MFS transporter [Candidatus Finniella inopinata]|uniref:MFS transporter n=1 Tax=Candidatus Finniella inopinata TaxID=1696036 RepID=A0A4Q7DHP5_9PROT|nr:MFS transporter [Candidatus Finniella inopinata]RZI46461.1 MFS transporter [Candidatus Finniella inopinata]
MASLTRQQKEAVGLLQIGTFLEYFDLMLYVHMAVLLNELFFPKTDSYTESLIASATLCSTYVFRPFGALLFGYIGDTIGRKKAIIITTSMMSLSCLVIANLPTYAQIGITATLVVTICRTAQGLSSMGEVIGAEVYVSEITKPSAGYSAVAFISVSCAAGAMAAVGIAALVTSYGFNWRMAFWIGACIAVIASVARTRLRETPEFVDMKRKEKRLMEERAARNPEQSTKQLNRAAKTEQPKAPITTLVNCFFINCGWPLSFYVIYIYFNPILKKTFGYSPEDIIFHNFILTIIQVLTFVMWSVLTRHVYPLKLLKIKGFVSLALMAAIPLFLVVCKSGMQLILFQALILTFTLHNFPAEYIFLKRLPVYTRFTSAGLIYA